VIICDYFISQGQTVVNSRFNDDGSGGSSQVYSSGQPNYGSTSSFVSSSNVNGQQETVSSVNNNGHVQTYRQRSGK